MKICNLWLFLFGVMLFCACDDNNVEEIKDQSSIESFFLNLNLKATTESSTKADNNNPVNESGTKDGSFIENYIDIANNDIHIAVFNSSGDFITEFTGEEITNKKEDNQTASHFLGLLFKDDKIKDFPKDFKNEEFTVIILANWKSFTGKDYATFEGKNIKDTNSHDNLWKESSFYNFDYKSNLDNSWYPSLQQNSKSLIPMMGMGKFTGFSNSSGSGMPTATLTVIMLRSLAKITLSLNDNLWKSGFEIENCKLNKIASKGWLIPDMSETGNTFDYDNGMHISIPWNTKGVEQSTPLSFVKIGDEGTNKVLTAYIPEMNTSGYTIESEDRPFLTANMTLNKSPFKDEKNIEFKDNQGSTTKLFHILRNHHYDFIIQNITDDGKILISYNVCPWEEGSVDIEFK